MYQKVLSLNELNKYMLEFYLLYEISNIHRRLDIDPTDKKWEEPMKNATEEMKQLLENIPNGFLNFESVENVIARSVNHYISKNLKNNDQDQKNKSKVKSKVQKI